MSEFDEYIRQGEKGPKEKAQAWQTANINRSQRTVKSMTVRLSERGLLVRKNGKRNGWWETNA